MCGGDWGCHLVSDAQECGFFHEELLLLAKGLYEALLEFLVLRSIRLDCRVPVGLVGVSFEDPLVALAAVRLVVGDLLLEEVDGFARGHLDG